MKHLFFALLATVALFSCKPEKISNAPAQFGPGNYRAGFVSASTGDTTWTATRSAARIETTGLDSAGDTKLKAVLIAYDGHGVYTLQVTNLTDCQQIIRWSWDGNLSINVIQPLDSTANTPQSDVLKAHQTKTFQLIGTAKTGRIKLQAENQTGQCGNSSTLIISITTAILPIVYTDFNVTYNESLGRVFINFTISDPADLRCTVIQHLDGKDYKTVLVALGDDNIAKYSIKLP